MKFMNEIEVQHFSKFVVLLITPPNEGPNESPMLIDKFQIEVARSFPPSELSISSKILIIKQIDGIFIRAAEIPEIKIPSSVVKGDLNEKKILNNII